MTNLIVKGHQFRNSIFGIDVDFRFYTEDGKPVMMKDAKGDDYHGGQVSSSFHWAVKDAHDHFIEELNSLYPDGWSLQFEFTELNDVQKSTLSIREQCERLYDDIRQAESKLKELRASCPHTDTHTGNYSYRPGSYDPAKICSDCGEVVEVITQ